MSDDSVKGIARGGAVNLAGTAVNATMTFVLTILVTRTLSQEAAGVFFSITSAFLVATALAQLGTNTGLVYFIARSRALELPGRIPTYVRTAVVPVLAWSVVLGVTVAVFAPRLGEVLSPDQPDLASSYIRGLALLLPFAATENLFLSACRGLGTMKANAVVAYIGRPTLQCALVTAAVLLSGSSGAVLGWGGAYLATSVSAFLWWRSVLARTQQAAADDGVRRRPREFWSFTWPRAVMAIVQMAMQRLDIVLVGAIAGAAPAALYAAATRFIVAGQMGVNAIALSAQPRLAHTLAIDDHDAVNEIYRTSTAWLIAMTWPLYVTLLFFATPLMSVFGENYGDATDVITLLALAMMVSTLLGMVEMVLTMAGRTTWTLTNTLVGFAIQIGLDLWLIPRLGVLGAAIGWSAAIVVRNAAALVQVRASLRLHPFGRATTASVGLSLAAFAGAGALGRFLFGETVAGLLFALAVGGVGYAAGLWFLRGPLQLSSLVGGVTKRRANAESLPVSSGDVGGTQQQ